jgi:hypothetical protein
VALLIVLPIVIISLAMLALEIYTIVDVARYPDWAFERAGTSKTLWLVLSIVLVFACSLAALVVDLVWLTSKRAEVQRAAAAGPYATPGPPPGWAAAPPPPTAPPPPPPGPPASPGPPPRSSQ